MRAYGWELLVLCHYTDKSCDHQHCHGGDIMFLICHLIFVNLCVEAHYRESSPCHVWRPLSSVSGGLIVKVESM